MARFHVRYSGLERVYGFSYSHKYASFHNLSFISILAVYHYSNLSFRIVGHESLRDAC